MEIFLKYIWKWFQNFTEHCSIYFKSNLGVFGVHFGLVNFHCGQFYIIFHSSPIHLEWHDLIKNFFTFNCMPSLWGAFVGWPWVARMGMGGHRNLWRFLSDLALSWNSACCLASSALLETGLAQLAMSSLWPMARGIQRREAESAELSASTEGGFSLHLAEVHPPPGNLHPELPSCKLYHHSMVGEGLASKFNIYTRSTAP